MSKNSLHKHFKHFKTFSLCPNIQGVTTYHDSLFHPKGIFRWSTNFEKHVSCFYAQIINVAVWAFKYHAFLSLFVNPSLNVLAVKDKTEILNHKKSFTNDKYEKETELSKHVCNLKKSNKQYSISWSIIKRAAAFAPGMSRCNLCIEEKLCIMQNLLNNRSEIFAKCRHHEKFRAGKLKRARTSNDGADITPPNYRSRDY